MIKKKIEEKAELYLERTIKLLGQSKYYKHTPFLSIEYSPDSYRADNQWKGEFVSEDNEIIIYTKNIKSNEDLVRTVVHEYAHYLQSPAWMKRYYDIGYNYKTHPYEVEAYLIEEQNWKKICK